MALSLKEGSYLSHSSAVFLHGLNTQLPSTIYVNKEQSVKPLQNKSLTQDSLNNSFANNQRESNCIFRLRDSRIVLLSGKNTNALEVIEIAGPQGESLRTTSIARTLIDITVRPNYSGGAYQVVEAFKGARERVSGSSIITVLKNLNYVYPYHQDIGFYMSQAGFPSAETAKLRKLGLEFDFYLALNIHTGPPAA